MRLSARAAVAAGALAALLVGPLPTVERAAAAQATPTSAGRPPVYDADAPDPDMLRVDASYYTYTTNAVVWYGAFLNAPVLRSGDLGNWELVGDALPELGSWAQSGRTWAPSVERFGSRYVMFYTARHRSSGRQCIGRATSGSPTGPFTPEANPVKCQTSLGGSIDPYVFRDPATGAAYFYWKNDGNCCGIYTTLWAQRLTASGALTGGERALITGSQTWERPAIENPAMVRKNGRYWLFYSGGSWESSSYATGYATCSGPMGPCTKRTLRGPWYTTTPHGTGTGGASFEYDMNNEPWMSYHGWRPGVGYNGTNRRALFLDKVSFGSTPQVNTSYPYARHAAPDVAIPGDYGADPAHDVLWYGRFTLPDELWTGLPDRSFTPLVGPDVTVNSGSYRPLSGDFDGDGFDDVVWYAPGSPADVVWFGQADGSFASTSVTVNGSYAPVSGDWNGDGRDDLFWHAPGRAQDHVWFGQADRTFTTAGATVRGSYHPLSGDFDDNGFDDLLWYAPGSGADFVWWGGSGGFSGGSVTVNGSYRPFTGDFDGDGPDDVIWYGPGATADVVWWATGNRGFTSGGLTVNGEYAPFSGDFDGDGSSDVYWYGFWDRVDVNWWGDPSRTFTGGPNTPAG